jgi:hypothetical protein
MERATHAGVIELPRHWRARVDYHFVILALLGTGVVMFVRVVGRGAKRVAGKGGKGGDHPEDSA